ncbi:MAG TPA: phosphoribosyl-AMP cyclohydrolase [Planctomycetota bacterium]|nr:phosphoribosyl-AMP cyclohydrolase [Planctomycetota bacterium]
MSRKLELKYNEQGLIPAVVQDDVSGEVLMMAWMNEEAVRKTLETGRATFYSRSRRKLWVKGERSGHVQEVRSVRVDCDGDTLLLRVEQKGGACHKGYRSCFFTEFDADGNPRVVAEKLFDPDDVYGKSG